MSVYLERFAGLSPLKKLNQGYSYVADKYKKTLTSVEQVQNGDTIYISVTDGTIEADVTGTVKEERIYGEERKLRAVTGGETSGRDVCRTGSAG